MKKYRWIIISLLILISIVFLIKKCQKKVNHFTFPNTLIVQNNTSYERADTISMVILNRIFLVDTVKIYIYYMTNNRMDSKDVEVQAFIKRFSYEPHTYIIYLRKPPIDLTIERILSHELIHLKQMNDGELIELNDSINIYKGDTINLYRIKYEDRLYEKYAYKNEVEVRKKLDNLLYSK